MLCLGVLFNGWFDLAGCINSVDIACTWFMYGRFDLLAGVKMLVCYCLFGCVMLWCFVLLVFYRYNGDCWFVCLVWDCYCLGLVWVGCVRLVRCLRLVH